MKKNIYSININIKKNICDHFSLELLSSEQFGLKFNFAEAFSRFIWEDCFIIFIDGMID